MICLLQPKKYTQKGIYLYHLMKHMLITIKDFKLIYYKLYCVAFSQAKVPNVTNTQKQRNIETHTTDAAKYLINTVNIIANIKATKRLATYIGQLFNTSFKASYPSSMVSNFVITAEFTAFS